MLAVSKASLACVLLALTSFTSAIPHDFALLPRLLSGGALRPLVGGGNNATNGTAPPDNGTNPPPDGGNNGTNATTPDNTSPFSIDRIWTSTHDMSPWITDITSRYPPSSLQFVYFNSSNASANLFPSPNQRRQSFEGWGAAISDATATVLQDIRSQNETNYQEMLKLLFDPSPEYIEKGGAGLNFARVAFGTADFSLVEYTLDDRHDGSPDVNLTGFSINESPKLLKTLTDIVAIQPQIKIIYSVWSAPGWMKENATDDRPNSLHGGNIQTQYYQAYANYLARAVKEFRDQGIPAYRLALQNEPTWPSALYPSTNMTAEAQADIGDLVRAALDANNSTSVGLLAGDDAWNATDYPLAVFNRSDVGSFVGTGYHCYGGNPSAQDTFDSAYPRKEIHLTQCRRSTQDFNEGWPNLKKTGDIIDSIGYRARSVTLSTAVLNVSDDGTSGPSLPNGCQSCVSALLVADDGTYKLSSDFAALAHGSLATRLREGEQTSKVIGVSSTEASLVSAGFVNDLGNGTSRFSLYILQKNDHSGYGDSFDNVTAVISFRNTIASIELPVGLHTITWHAPTKP